MLNGLAVALDADEGRIARANASWAAQGFATTGRRRFESGVVCGFIRAERMTPGGSPQEWGVQMSEGFACGVGPIWYRRRFGPDALRLLLREVARSNEGSLADLDRSSLRGNYAIFLCTRNRAWLFNDPLGLQHIYHVTGNRYFATSWLAARAYTGDAEIDEVAATEYVLQGACHSERTVARGVLKMRLGHEVDLRSGTASPSTGLYSAVTVEERNEPKYALDAAIEIASDHLHDVFRDIVAAFPDRVNAALSGGFDSRLIVAALLSLGERPRLFVYGSSDSPDVAIARDIAACEGLDLDPIDKGILDLKHDDLDREGLVRNALFFDGLPNDGIDDRGADRETRLGQTAGGRIALNGGGGEIFRNFYHLPDRTYTPRDLVRTFYRGFDASVFRRASGLADYEEALGCSILGSLQMVTDGTDKRRPDVLSRRAVELVYPLFRCHHWMGLNNTAVLRHGYFCTPLVDLTTVNFAASLPLHWKNAGMFESRLIVALHRRIASYPSAYGFRMIQGPGWRARLNEAVTCSRPVWARPAINALHRCVKNGRNAAAPVLKKWRDVLTGTWILDPVLDFSRLDDPAMLSRLLAVEIVARDLAP
jgi:hypothetical protein